MKEEQENKQERSRVTKRSKGKEQKRKRLEGDIRRKATKINGDRDVANQKGVALAPVT